MFPSVWSSLLMVKRQALGTFVSLLMVILRGRRGRYLRGSPSRTPPHLPQSPPAPSLLTSSLPRRGGRTRRPEARSWCRHPRRRLLFLLPRRHHGARPLPAAHSGPWRPGGPSPPVRVPRNGGRGSDPSPHTHEHTPGVSPVPPEGVLVVTLTGNFFSMTGTLPLFPH